jgi:hypothetical protein
MQWNRLTRTWVGVGEEDVHLGGGVMLPPSEWVKVYTGSAFGPYAVYDPLDGQHGEAEERRHRPHAVIGFFVIGFSWPWCLDWLWGILHAGIKTQLVKLRSVLPHQVIG